MRHARVQRRLHPKEAVQRAGAAAVVSGLWLLARVASVHARDADLRWFAPAINQ